MFTFKKLERSFGAVVEELEKAFLNVRGIKVVKHVAAAPKKRQRGLTSGILRILAKQDNPTKIADIVKKLPRYGYRVRDPSRAKLSVSQTLHRLVGNHRVVHPGRGLYKTAIAV